MKLISLVTFLAIGILAACQGFSAADTLAPREAIVGELTLHTEWARGEIQVGEVDTLIMTLTNHGSDDVTLSFNSGCQILPHIETPTGASIIPGKPGWYCTGALTSLTIPAGASVTRIHTIRGGSPMPAIHADTPLEPGRYIGYARLAQSELRSANAPLVVRSR